MAETWQLATLTPSRPCPPVAARLLPGRELRLVGRGRLVRDGAAPARLCAARGCDGGGHAAGRRREARAQRRGDARGVRRSAGSNAWQSRTRRSPATPPVRPPPPPRRRRYGCAGVTVRTGDGRAFGASQVISTLPLGVLQRRHLQIFAPPLPEKHRHVLESDGVAMGNLTHVVVPPRPPPPPRLTLTLTLTTPAPPSPPPPPPSPPPPPPSPPPPSPPPPPPPAPPCRCSSRTSGGMIGSSSGSAPTPPTARARAAPPRASSRSGTT